MQIKTYGIKYMGSKLHIIPYIYDLIKDLKIKNVLDGFSGTTRVSQAFAQIGYNVTCNDLSEWSKIFGQAFLLREKDDLYYQKLIAKLNSLDSYKGWFSEHYGGTDLLKRRNPFQLKNTMKLDAIRDEIDKMDLNEIDKSVLLTSLIFALEKIDNTLGHYASYLKEWSNRSYKDLELKLPPKIISKGNHKIIQGNVFDLLNEEYDLVYYDPPYGGSTLHIGGVRYNAYYHFYKTVILNDKPELFGKANRRVDSIGRTAFEEYKKDENNKYYIYYLIKELIEKTKAKYILFSYNNNGRIKIDELFEIFSNYNIINIIKKDHKKNIMSKLTLLTEESKYTTKENFEYLFLIET